MTRFILGTAAALLAGLSVAAGDPPRTPTLFIVGDSTVKNGTKGQQGWGRSDRRPLRRDEDQGRKSRDRRPKQSHLSDGRPLGQNPRRRSARRLRADPNGTPRRPASRRTPAGPRQSPRRRRRDQGDRQPPYQKEGGRPRLRLVSAQIRQRRP